VPGAEEPAAPRRSKTRKASPKERRVNRYLRRHFSSGISANDAWYGHVEGVAVAGTTTTVDTDLADDRAGRPLAKQICISVRGAIPGLTDSVRVQGAEGETLASCIP
jgi:predicted nucleic acid-binding protein